MRRTAPHRDAVDHGLAHAGVAQARHLVASVESAALAGTGAAVLFTCAGYLLARQPGILGESPDLRWYTDSGHRTSVVVAVNLAALGVVAFLWFMAVVRRRLGEREDQFFATVFLGAGLALSVLVIAAAVAAALPTLVVWLGYREVPDRDTVTLAHALWYGLWGIGGSRLVGVFMAATSTVGLRFGAFPRWLGVFGIVMGAILGLTGAFVGPLDILFPLWLLVVSLTLLVTGRARRRSVPDGA